MAFAAGYIFMTAIQFKPGFVMVKFYRFPVFKSMAFQACHLFFFRKLTEMNIGMTGLTLCRQATE
jgi:hypothetical protein